MTQPTIESVLNENRTFAPPEAFASDATIGSMDKYQELYDRAAADPAKFWAELAESELHWFEKWHTVLDWQPPVAKWFDGGKINITYNCLDRHLTTARKNKAAIIWEGEPGDSRTYTYAQLHREVCKAANAIKAMGVKKGDRVGVYMPMVPEAAIAMLACARIGAVHSVVFGGFSAEALRDRLNDGEAKLVITADGGYRKDKTIPLKSAVDAALANLAEFAGRRVDAPSVALAPCPPAAASQSSSSSKQPTHAEPATSNGALSTRGPSTPKEHQRCRPQSNTTPPPPHSPKIGRASGRERV